MPAIPAPPIPVEVLRRVNLIITHDSCSDGTASAIILHDALPDAEIEFHTYNTEKHRNIPARDGVLFCDFTPMKERVHEFVAAGAIVLDHHKATREIVEMFTHARKAWGVYADLETEPGVSGAVLALRHVWHPLRAAFSRDHSFVQRFAEITGIRDTWQTKSAHWAEAAEQDLTLRSMTNQQWLGYDLPEIAQMWNTHFAWLGATLSTKHARDVQAALERAFFFESKKWGRVVCIDRLSLATDIAEATRGLCDLVVGFGYENGKTMKFSLRLAEDSALDVSTFAQKYGGGGHQRAAGFSVPLDESSPQPFVLIRRALEWEGVLSWGK